MEDTLKENIEKLRIQLDKTPDNEMVKEMLKENEKKLVEMEGHKEKNAAAKRVMEETRGQIDDFFSKVKEHNNEQIKLAKDQIEQASSK